MRPHARKGRHVASFDEGDASFGDFAPPNRRFSGVRDPDRYLQDIGARGTLSFNVERLAWNRTAEGRGEDFRTADTVDGGRRRPQGEGRQKYFEETRPALIPSPDAEFRWKAIQ